MVKNEQDIIEPFIRHHARLVDCMVILDNASVDDTRRIIVECARELGNIVVADSEEFTFTQSERMTRLVKLCQAAFFADFILLLDADEFVAAPDRIALLAALETIPANGVGLLSWSTFVLAPDQVVGASVDPPRSIRRRRAEELPRFRKAVLRLDGRYRSDLVVGQGNHGVLVTDGDALPGIELERPALLHFPVRSRNQLVSKSVVGWMASLARDPASRERRTNFQWREAFDRLLSSNGELETGELAEVSMRYAQRRGDFDWSADTIAGEPPADYVRRYSDGSFSAPLVVIARSWERSLAKPPPLLKLTRPAAQAADARASATAFDADWHWDHLFVDVPPFLFLAETLRPATVLDIGCGIGAYLEIFRRMGASRVLGVDGVTREAVVLGEGEYRVHDLAAPLVVDGIFDLVICTEVAEHLDNRYAATVLDSVARHAGRTIVFSAAEPGQPGNGHINCQPISFWLAQWAVRGWHPDLIASLSIRALATMSWFRRNLIVLRQDAPDPEAVAVLTAIGEKPFTWYGQAPGIRHFAFTEDLPAPPAGYATAGVSR